MAVPITVIVLNISSVLVYASKSHNTTPFTRNHSSKLRKIPSMLGRLLWCVCRGFWYMWKRDPGQTTRPRNQSMPVFDFIRGPVSGEGRHRRYRVWDTCVYNYIPNLIRWAIKSHPTYIYMRFTFSILRLGNAWFRIIYLFSSCLSYNKESLYK